MRKNRTNKSSNKKVECLSSKLNNTNNEDIFKLLKTSVILFIKSETSSIGAKLNLIGGLCIVFLIIAIFVPDLIVHIFNIILRLLDKSTLPELPSWNILIAITILALYFLFCSRAVLNKNK